jgi:hypothetical protein
MAESGEVVKEGVVKRSSILSLMDSKEGPGDGGDLSRRANVH